MAALTLYFDGNCPFCAAEMQRLQRWDRNGALAFVDIAMAGFDPATLGVSFADLDREIHSVNAKGEMLIGIDSLLAAYTLVGKAWIVWPLRVRMLRPPLASAYRWFARNRYRFSGWLGYGFQKRASAMPHCESGVCTAGNPFLRGSTTHDHH